MQISSSTYGCIYGCCTFSKLFGKARGLHAAATPIDKRKTLQPFSWHFFFVTERLCIRPRYFNTRDFLPETGPRFGSEPVQAAGLGGTGSSAPGVVVSGNIHPKDGIPFLRYDQALRR
jgi:hypothetical protein